MKNRILFVFLAMVLVVSLAAFAACAAEEEVVEEGVWQWPDKIIVASSGTGEQFYAGAIAWSVPFEKDTGATVRVVVHPVMTTRWMWLKEGEIDLTTVKQSGKPWIEGERANATREGGPWQVRGWWVSGQRDKGWATTPGTGIKTPEDIKPGTKIIYSAYLGPPDSASNQAQLGLIAWAQVAVEDIKWIPAASKAATTRLLMDGKGDIAYVESTVGAAWFEVAASPRGLAFIDVDAKANPEGAVRYRKHHVDVTFAEIATGLPQGIGHYGMSTLGQGNVSADQDPELMYRWVKWMHENHDIYKDAHTVLGGYTVENVMTMAEYKYLVYHEGVVRYLQELGVWTEKAEENQQYHQNLLNEYIKRYQAAIAEADSKGIEVTPENTEWIKLWYSHRKGIPELVWRYPGVEVPIY